MTAKLNSITKTDFGILGKIYFGTLDAFVTGVMIQMKSWQQAKVLSTPERHDLLGTRINEPFITYPIPVTFRLGPWVCVGIGALLVLGSIWSAYATWQAHQRAGSYSFDVVLLVGGLTLIAGGFYINFKRTIPDAVIAMFEKGILIAWRDQLVAIRSSDLENLAISEDQIFNNGKYVGVFQNLCLESGNLPIKCAHFTSLNAAEAGQNLFSSCLDTLIEWRKLAMIAKLKAGKSISGTEWRLDSNGIHSTKLQNTIPIQSIGAVGTLQKEVIVWKTSDPKPALKIGRNTSDALPLYKLLDETIRKRLQGQYTCPDTYGFELFRRNPSRDSARILFVMSVAVIILGLILRLSSNGSLTDDMWLYGSLAMLCVLLLQIGRKLWGLEYSFHELGLRYTGWFKARELPYRSIKSFLFSKTRMYRNGLYAGTRIAMKFTPFDGKPIQLYETIRGTDDDYEKLKDIAAEFVAQNLENELRSSDLIPWVPNLSFYKNELALTVKKGPLGFGKAQTKAMPYGESVRYLIDKGQMALVDGISGTPFATIPCSADNFYPGLKLLERLCREASERAKSTPVSNT